MKQKKRVMPVELPVYRYWQALFGAFYSKALYIDVVKRWQGFGFIYLLLLISVVTMPLAVRIIIDFNHYFNEKIIQPLEAIPPLYIHNGKISVNQSMPYLMKNKEGVVEGVIDTQATMMGFDDNQYPNLIVLITNDTFFWKLPPFDLFLKQLSPIGHSDVLVETLSDTMSDVFVAKQWIQSSGVLWLKWGVDCIIYPVLVSLFLGLYFGLLLVLTMLVQSIAWLLFKTKLTFKQSARILMVSSTPHIVLLFGLLVANALFPGVGVVCLMLGLIYLSFAVLSCRGGGLGLHPTSKASGFGIDFIRHRDI